jgi:polyphosphate kinase 2 (PPK2 family)
MSKNVQGEYDTAETTKALGKMSRRNFETELAELQVELTQLQTWVKHKSARVIVVFED